MMSSRSSRRHPAAAVPQSSLAGNTKEAILIKTLDHGTQQLLHFRRGIDERQLNADVRPDFLGLIAATQNDSSSSSKLPAPEPPHLKNQAPAGHCRSRPPARCRRSGRVEIAARCVQHRPRLSRYRCHRQRRPCQKTFGTDAPGASDSIAAADDVAVSTSPPSSRLSRPASAPTHQGYHQPVFVAAPTSASSSNGFGERGGDLLLQFQCGELQ